MKPFSFLHGLLKDTSDFRAALIEAVSDGKLTPEEVEDLEAMREELHLTDRDLGEARAAAYAIAFHAATADQQVTDEEWSSLEDIQVFLGLKDGEIARNKKELWRLLILSELRRGNMPIVRVPGLLLKKGETPYWSEPVRSSEEDTDGLLVITNKRIVFRSAKKSTAWPLGSILEAGCSAAKTRIVPNSKPARTFIHADSSNSGILQGILASVLSERER
jgi:hypothetical protein